MGTFLTRVVVVAGCLTLCAAGSLTAWQAVGAGVDPAQDLEASGAARADSIVQELVDSLAAADGDSVVPATPSTQVLPTEVDADGDGVPAVSDFCPDSPPGQRVDETGCPVEARPPWHWAVAGMGGLVALRILWIPIGLFRRRRARKAELKRLAQLAGGDVPGVGGDPTRSAHRTWAAAPPSGPWAVPPTVPGQAPPIQHPPGGTDPTGFPPPTVGFPASPQGSEPLGGVRPVAPIPGESSAGVGYPAIPEGVSPPPLSSPPPAPTPPPPGELGDPAAVGGLAAEISGGVGKWKDDPLVYGNAGRGRFGVVGRHPMISLIVVLVAGLGVVWWTQDRPGLPRARTLTGPQPTQSAPIVVALTPDTSVATPSRGPIPSQIRMVAGDGQSGRVGQTLLQALEIRVEDADGEAVPNVPVFWEATVGGGRMSPSTIQTDPDGIARTLWTLGPQVITQYAVAKVAGFEEAGVAFEAGARPGIAARLSLLRGSGQSAPPGSLLNEAVVVRVESVGGQALEGIPVRFTPQGDGAVAVTEMESDPLGEARTAWTVGVTGDSARLRVEVVGSPGLVVDLAAAIAYPRIPAVAGVVAGGTHSCALASNGVLSCWGANQSGQLGIGGATRSPAPARVAPGARYSVVSAGLSHTCAVEQQGEVFCWGDNANGQLGTGSRSPSRTPIRAASDTRFRSVSAGTGHTCGVSRSLQVLCWGSNVNGQLGDGTNLDREVPTRVAVSGPYQSVSVGWFHTCALTNDGRANCWGRNAFGQIGDGTTTDRQRPTPATGPVRFRRVSAGGAHTCGLGTDGQIHCWGQNNFGQLGDGSGAPQGTPVPVAVDGPWREIAVGGVHSCGLASDGTAYCWGRNTNGQLGDGTTQDRPTPTPVAGGHSFSSIYASGAHTCGTMPGGQSLCWGYNIEGQLGDGSRENRLVPTLVGGA